MPSGNVGVEWKSRRRQRSEGLRDESVALENASSTSMSRARNAVRTHATARLDFVVADRGEEIVFVSAPLAMKRASQDSSLLERMLKRPR